MFTTSDLQQLSARGITPDQAQRQMQTFVNGFPSLDIVAPASVENGIICPTPEQEDAYIAAWQQYLSQGHQVLKFVPASGAASRMFKDLFVYAEGGEETPYIQQFLSNIPNFAFGDKLQGKLGRDAVNFLLHDMSYGVLPKGLLLFHTSPTGPRTPVMEHMAEGAMYAASQGQVYIHFTVSHEHLALFCEHVQTVQPALEQQYGVRYHISYSQQKPSTDTLAANPDATPFRTPDGRLVFRPGGHGALIENLNEQQADVIFIKNIDNVVPDSRKEDTIRYKQILAGVLITEQQRVFERLSDPLISEHERSLLQRPIRVCGVVKNTGEPGGGPFLVREKNGEISRQILESVQISNPSLMKQATHFNPVDLVCATRKVDGSSYYLPDFVDPDTGFISQKSKDGKPLQALELPGLWNGAMSRWNTIFVQVPISTFNPVKSVNDLLREQHQF